MMVWTRSISFLKFSIVGGSHSFRRMASTTMTKPTINLTPPERLFKQCLLDCRTEMSHISGMQDLQIRFTGGWVRDKLLGTTSHDIDVALSTMTGEKFGMALKSFMQSHGQRYESEANSQGFKAEIKNLHKIEANPEKSKHLETITTRMFGIDVDFVNLRKEVYDELSRNPQVEFGTPEEDALRRDATVNALFYNLDTREVEDFTKRGLDDMSKKIIRTPLAPYQTFKDDPLRVLRLIRFASRLGYSIDAEALKSMSDPTIHEALRLKISRERVGVEVNKIMAGPDPYTGLMYIYDLELYRTVFADPRTQATQPDFSIAPIVFGSLQKLLVQDSALCLSLRPKDDLGLAWTLASYVPWKDSEVAAVTAGREALRAPNVTLKVLGDAIKYRTQISHMVERVLQGQSLRADVGVMLRSAGHSWRFHVLFSILCDFVEGSYENVTRQYQTFIQFIQEQQLEDACNLKPILNGNEIKNALEVQRAGSWLKSAIDVVVEWQFANPQATREDAIKMIKERRQELVPA